MVCLIGIRIGIILGGAELMATIGPDNVVHPHLRAHVEFMLGLFASVHLARGDSAGVLLSEFLLGCGIWVEVADLSEPSWVADAYNQRHKNPVSVVRPMCHTSWGAKVRPLAFRQKRQVAVRRISWCTTSVG